MNILNIEKVIKEFEVYYNDDSTALHCLKGKFKDSKQNLNSAENTQLDISDNIKRYVVKYKSLKPVSFGEEIVNATSKWNAFDIFMNMHQYYDVIDVNDL